MIVENSTFENSIAGGYIIDESAPLRKGKDQNAFHSSVGVTGKVDNCMVGVYASLVNKNDATIINKRLFLPEAWTNDKIRCKLAGISDAFHSFKTKPELAMECSNKTLPDG